MFYGLHYVERKSVSVNAASLLCTWNTQCNCS